LISQPSQTPRKIWT